MKGEGEISNGMRHRGEAGSYKTSREQNETMKHCHAVVMCLCRGDSSWSSLCPSGAVALLWENNNPLRLVSPVTCHASVTWRCTSCCAHPPFSDLRRSPEIVQYGHLHNSSLWAMGRCKRSDRRGACPRARVRAVSVY